MFKPPNCYVPHNLQNMLHGSIFLDKWERIDIRSRNIYRNPFHFSNLTNIKHSTCLVIGLDEFSGSVDSSTEEISRNSFRFSNFTNIKHNTCLVIGLDEFSGSVHIVVFQIHSFFSLMNYLFRK